MVFGVMIILKILGYIKKTNIDINSFTFEKLKEKIVEDLNYLNDNK